MKLKYITYTLLFILFMILINKTCINADSFPYCVGEKWGGPMLGLFLGILFLGEEKNIKLRRNET